MRRFAFIVLTFVGGFSAGVVAAATTDAKRNGERLTPRSFPVSQVRSYSYASSIMARTYDITIGFPQGYAENPDKQYPVLVVTDGNRMFSIVHAVSSNMAGMGERIQQPVIIGIGTPFEEGEGAWHRRRVYEFSTPGWPMKDPFGQYIAEVCDTKFVVERKECIGGAPKFLEFIVSELLPDLFVKHRIDANDLGLFGVSAGGFFASWVIFQKNSPFNRYIISSPAMAYGDGEVLRQEQAYAKTHEDLPVQIYLSSGTLEIDSPFLEGIGKIVSGQARLGGLLRSRNYGGLKLYSEIHQGLGHTDVVPTSVARGFRLMYAKPDKLEKPAD